MRTSLIPALALLPLVAPVVLPAGAAETVAFWAFDEAVGAYPSSALADHSHHELTLVLGPGGSIVPGRFGNALAAIPQPEVEYPMGGPLFGLMSLPPPAGRSVPPLSWRNAHFAALLTRGENHLRKEVAQRNPTETGVNLGAFDWTVEFWYRPRPGAPSEADGVVLEIGEGPRGENDHVTALLLNARRTGFILVNQPAGTRLEIPSEPTALQNPGAWTHVAFVYEAGARELVHYIDGHPQGQPLTVTIAALPRGPEAYLSIGRDGAWQRPLPGLLDELRISRGRVYPAAFPPPGSLVADPDAGAPAKKPEVTQPLLFPAGTGAETPVDLGGRKYLFLDDALFPVHHDVAFVPTPPRRVERVLPLPGSYRKHAVVLEDEQGVVRLYLPAGKQDRLAVFTSRDGVHFEAPHLSALEPDYPNLVTEESAGTPSVFRDPLAPPAERWKLVSGDEGEGIFVFTSSDGFTWKRLPTAALSARSGSQTNMFYDDQRGEYVGYHRTDSGTNTFGKTERRFVMSVVDSLRPPWPFQPLTQADYRQISATMRLHDTRPWYLDNGPLTPGGVGVEYPVVFRPIDGFDPPATDIYVPKAVKYPWAPDAYLAFPCVYFHYEEAQPATRGVLGDEEHRRGSGPIETQLMTSRDALHWKRYPRPVWLDVGLTDGWDVHQTYMAQGMVRRGDEIWMYVFDDVEYHSPFGKKDPQRGVFRTVQRLDRFVAAEAPYDREAMLFSRPFTFSGRRLQLNVDTGATGFVQVGLLRGNGLPIAGYGLNDCVYINGNELRYDVQWLGRGADLSAFSGQPVRLVVRMRGARLFSLKFVSP